ncbi:tumor protein D54-like [Dendronephthya gigantea]|uniref:tumor protein D54-like n=1 Tax=Dendronephthya gigantea TaxID=151771 RepID=UPI00106CF491|nr:tumor protein D54-like [Dendronephthya gigantea]
MMESTANGDENIAPVEDESPFGDGEKVLEAVDMQTDEDAAAEEARKEEIRKQMAKLEEEMTSLRNALERKEKQYADLKKELGITRWSQLREGIGTQINYIQNSEVMKKTSETIKGWNDKIVQSGAYNKTCKTLSGASEATTNALKSAGAVTAKKIGELRDSDTFKSIENKVSSATSSIKGKVVGQKPYEPGEEGIDEVDPNMEHEPVASS